MRRWSVPPALAAAVASLLVAQAAVAAAPARWELSAFHGFLLGGALYAGALRRTVASGTLGRGALFRIAAFLLFAGTQAIVCFELTPDVDVRGIFVILSSWIVMETAAV